jgi:hypothetical protein
MYILQGGNYRKLNLFLEEDHHNENYLSPIYSDILFFKHFIVLLPNTPDSI